MTNKCPVCKSKDFIAIYDNKNNWIIVERWCMDCDYTEKIEKTSP